MQINLSLPAKSPLRSKAVWTAIVSGALGVYELVGPAWAPPLPPIPEGVYLILGAFGLYGLRAARRPLDLPGTPQAAPAPSYSIPDASLALPGAGITNPAGVRAQSLPDLPDAAYPADAQPLLGGGVAAIAGSLLGSSMLEGIVRALLAASGLPAGAQQVLQVGARLAPVAPDLFDGHPQLSTENLARINRVILDLKAEHLGGSK